MDKQEFKHNDIKLTLYNGDCLDKMKDIPSGSVDMILTDPPYGTIKGMNSKLGVNGWEKRHTNWDDVINHELMLEECNRILRNNGCLILFSQDPYTAKLITEVHSNLPFSYRLTWFKDHFANALIAKKAPVNYTEDINVFFKKYASYDFEGLHPLRSYSIKLNNELKYSRTRFREEMGHYGFVHFMEGSKDSTQFSLCTEETYNQLIELYNIDELDFFIEYKELARINKTYREELIKKMTAESPKVFNLPEGKKYKSNVLEYKKDYTGHHPTQKPVALLEDLIKTYTNEGNLILDFTMGSGSTGVACKGLNRNFIGIELNEDFYNIACKRIQEENRQTDLEDFI